MKYLIGILFSILLLLSFTLQAKFANPLAIGPSPLFTPATPVSAFTNTLSLIFDGVDERVNIPNVAGQRPTSAMSVSCWAKGGSQSFKVVMAQYEGTNRKWWMGTNGTDKLDVIISADGGLTNAKDYRSTSAAFDSTWNQVGWSFSSNVLTIYVNGSAVVSPTKDIDGTVNSLFNNTADEIVMGDTGNNNALFTGSIDECSLWDAQLNAADFSNIYNSGTPTDLSTHAKSANLIGWYRNGDGDTFPTIIDQQGNSNGAMQNMEAGDIQSDTPP